MARPQHDPPLDARAEVTATTSDVEQWKAAAGDVPLSVWARRHLNTAARDISFVEACPERILIQGRSGGDKVGARVMLTPWWRDQTETGAPHRSLDLFLSREQAEGLVADLQRILAEPWAPNSERDHHHPAHPDWHPATDAASVPGWARWPGRPPEETP